MKYNAETLPMTTPMTVRKITPLHHIDMFGGVIVMDEYDVEEMGMADKRLDFDADIVDCSRRIFDITTCMMLQCKEKENFTVFPSRRWRNHRTGITITKLPNKEEPLLYIGNPVRLFSDPEKGITVVRLPEFLIKSGMELGF